MLPADPDKPSRGGPSRGNRPQDPPDPRAGEGLGAAFAAEGAPTGSAVEDRGPAGAPSTGAISDPSEWQLAAHGGEDPYPPIGDYAIIGDCCTAALITRAGAIEWLCVPNFSGPSIFAAILDRDRGGAFAIRPRGACRMRRRYLDETAILETTFTTSTGTVRVVDFMSIGDTGHPWSYRLRPQRELVRFVECLDGTVDLVASFEPRPDYGRAVARPVRRPGFGWVFDLPGAALTLCTDVEMAASRDGTGLGGSVTLAAGDIRTFGMGFDAHEVAVQPAFGGRAREALDATAKWWRTWAAACTFAGRGRDLMVRSAITLKLLTYALSGAMVAAATTSLPEAVGARRNFDYRYCWLRDSAITMRAFLGLGFRSEADAFLGWLLNATRLTRPELRILYDLHGRNDAPEFSLDHLDGYRGSRPVRIGNGAADQLQLDTYGAVVMAAYEYIDLVGPLSPGEMHLLTDFGEVVCRRWEEPDHGIWEIRGDKRHFTATKVLCWATLDRLVRLAERGLVRIPIDRFRQNRDRLADLIERRGFSSEQGAYLAELDGDHGAAADASILLMGWAGYGDPRGDRLLGTLDRVIETLGRDGLIARYPTGYDGVSSREGTFGACSAWAAILAARGGDVDRTRSILERLVETGNDVGLFSEEYDVENALALGNVPQAFTHAGFITATLELREAERHAMDA